MDFITTLPKLNRSTAILIIVDRLSRIAYFVLKIDEIDSIRRAILFRDRIFLVHGLINSLITNCSLIFASELPFILSKLLLIE
jgi:hypothetical protein